MKPQLAEKPDGKPITYPKYASSKLDGIRILTYGGNVYTRSLKQPPNKFITKTLSRPEYQGLDGEIIIGPPNVDTTYATTVSGLMSIEGEPDFTFYVFDTGMDTDDPFKFRYSDLKKVNLPRVVLLPQTVIHTDEELKAFYESNLADGYEGAILRNGDSRYKFGRCTAKSQDMLKMKPLETAEAGFKVGDFDFTILGLYEAETNLNEAFTNELGRTARSSHKDNKVGNGMLGGFHCVDKVGNKFNIGAGKLNHAERKNIWDIGFENLASVTDCLTFAFLPIGVKDAPRHPRFVGWRHTVDLC